MNINNRMNPNSPIFCIFISMNLPENGLLNYGTNLYNFNRYKKAIAL